MKITIFKKSNAGELYSFRFPGHLLARVTQASLLAEIKKHTRRDIFL